MSFINRWGAGKLIALCVLLVALALSPSVQAITVKERSKFVVYPGALYFNTSPDVPDLPVLNLDGGEQTLNGALNDWQVRDASGTGSGWNVNVRGDSSAGSSPVFKEYCTDGESTNGCDTAVDGGPGPGYVTNGESLDANSMVLSSSGASFNAIGGTRGNPPTHSCGSSCNIDSTSPAIIASAANGAGMGTYKATSYSQSSLSFSAPTTIKAIGSGNKVYSVELVWTLASGPS